MNIPVYGAGVIGSVYAARLQEVGYHVTLLARDQHAVSLRTQGILLEDASTGQRTTTRVSVIDHLAPMDGYDVVLVTVRMDQLASILPTLAANHRFGAVPACQELSPQIKSMRSTFLLEHYEPISDC